MNEEGGGENLWLSITTITEIARILKGGLDIREVGRVLLVV